MKIATIDAAPSPFYFDIDHIALVCIDMQQDFCLPGGFAESLENEHVIAKPGKDTFYRTDFHEYLMMRGITNLVITGVTTEVCVQTTMRCANDRGYDCLLIEDGTDSYTPEFKDFTLRAVTSQSGIVGWTCMAEKVLELLASL